MAFVEYPFLFDYARNPIETLDGPRVASPPPGMPLDSPDALRNYLVDGHGIQYLILNDFDASILPMFSRAEWELSRDDKGDLMKEMAPYYLSFMRAADALSATSETVYREDSLRVIKLR